MDVKKIKAIVELVQQSGIAELEIIEGEDKLKVSTLGHQQIISNPNIAPMPHQNHIVPPHISAPTQKNTTDSSNNPVSEPNKSDVIEGKLITSPMVGTFYQASSPNSAPFVEIGQTIKVGQVLCIIEAMKLLNQIEADQAGVIKEILVKDGSPVEYGQPLFVIA